MQDRVGEAVARPIRLRLLMWRKQKEPETARSARPFRARDGEERYVRPMPVTSVALLFQQKAGEHAALTANAPKGKKTREDVLLSR